MNKKLMLKMDEKYHITKLTRNVDTNEEMIEGEITLFINNKIPFRREIKNNMLIEELRFSGNIIIKSYDLTTEELAVETIKYVNSSEDFLYENEILIAHYKYFKDGGVKLIEKYEDDVITTTDFQTNIKTKKQKNKIVKINNLNGNILCTKIFKNNNELDITYYDGSKREITKNQIRKYNSYGNLIYTIDIEENNKFLKRKKKFICSDKYVEYIKNKIFNTVTINTNEYSEKIVYPIEDINKSVIIKNIKYTNLENELEEMNIRFVSNGFKYKINTIIKHYKNYTETQLFEYKKNKEITISKSNRDYKKKIIFNKNNIVVKSYNFIEKVFN